MGVPKKTKAKNRLPPFAAIPNDMLEGAAYQSLTPSAAKAYPYFLKAYGKRVVKDGKGCQFELTYSELEKAGFSRSTISRVIEELNEKGFISIVEVGGLRGCSRSNSSYRLSEGWRDYGKVVFDKVTRQVRPALIPTPRRPSEPPPSPSTKG